MHMLGKYPLLTPVAGTYVIINIILPKESTRSPVPANLPTPARQFPKIPTGICGRLL